LLNLFASHALSFADNVVLDQFQMFGLSKAVAEAKSNAAKEVESSLPLQTVLEE
jgi:hypothetical protein